MATSQQSSDDLSRSENYSRISNVSMSVLSMFVAKSPLNDLLGLEYLQFLLHIGIIQALQFSADLQSKQSEADHQPTLQRVLELIGSWEPLKYIVPDQVLEDSCTLNIPACFEAILLSMKNAISRFEELLEEPERHHNKQFVLHYFTAIKEHIERVKNVLTSKFMLYPPFSGDPNVDFHCQPLCFESGKSYLYDSNLDILHLVGDHRIPSALMCVQVNSPVAEKIKRLTYSDLLRSSTDSICQICRADLDRGQNLGCLHTCNHICCSRCIETWFETLYMQKDLWTCPTCRSQVQEYGEIKFDGMKRACELYEQMPGHEASQFLDLGSLSTLDCQLRCLMDSVDELTQEANKFNNYQRQVSKLGQDKRKYVIKRSAENSARRARGEPPLPEEDLTKLFKPIAPLPRLDATITAGQINTYCKELSQFCSQALGKLFVAKALQG